MYTHYQTLAKLVPVISPVHIILNLNHAIGLIPSPFLDFSASLTRKKSETRVEPGDKSVFVSCTSFQSSATEAADCIFFCSLSTDIGNKLTDRCVYTMQSQY